MMNAQRHRESPDAIEIRPAEPDDAERLQEIGVLGWETTYSEFVREENRRSYLNGEFWSVDRLREVCGDPGSINIVAKLDNRIIGFITTEPLDGDRFEVTRLYVDPDGRGYGIGGRLLDTVLVETRRRGATEVLVNVFGDNLAGRRFYERHGFELSEDTWTSVGDQRLSDVWYTITLAPSGN